MTSYSEPEWRWTPLSERLAFAYINQLFTDCDISWRAAEHPHAHKCILADSSPVLEQIIYGDAADDTSCATISSVDPEGISYILKYLYHVPSSTEKDKSILLSAYHAAKMLSMTSISAQLRDEIFNNLLDPSLTTKDDFWKLLELSRILELTDVTEALLGLAVRYPSNVLKAKSFVKASAGTVQRVMELDFLNVTELDILDGIVRWKLANCQLPFVEDFVLDLLACVRFRNLSTADFCQLVGKNTGLISQEDELKILMHLSLPSSCQLPSWCSAKFRISTPSESNKEFMKSITGRARTRTNQRRPASLLKLFSEQRYCDVCFLVGSDKIPIKAHRNILAVGSIVYEKMFFGPLPDMHDEIEVIFAHAEGFRTMIRYFYKESDLDYLLIDNPDLASQTLEVALKYGSNALKKVCMSHTAPKVSQIEVPKSFWKKLEWQTRNKPRVKGKVKELLDYAAKNTKEVLECHDFRNAPSDILKTFLLSHDLNVREIDLLNRVAEWIEQKRNFFKWNKEKYDVLGLIRFESITPDEFCSFLTKHDRVLPKEESFVIMRYMIHKDSELPSWCYKGPSRRNGLNIPNQNGKGQN